MMLSRTSERRALLPQQQMQVPIKPQNQLPSQETAEADEVMDSEEDDSFDSSGAGESSEWDSSDDDDGYGDLMADMQKGPVAARMAQMRAQQQAVAPQAVARQQ